MSRCDECDAPVYDWIMSSRGRKLVMYKTWAALALSLEDGFTCLPATHGCHFLTFNSHRETEGARLIRPDLSSTAIHLRTTRETLLYIPHTTVRCVAPSIVSISRSFQTRLFSISLCIRFGDFSSSPSHVSTSQSVARSCWPGRVLRWQRGWLDSQFSLAFTQLHPHLTSQPRVLIPFANHKHQWTTSPWDNVRQCESNIGRTVTMATTKRASSVFPSGKASIKRLWSNAGTTIWTTTASAPSSRLGCSGVCSASS